MKLTIHSKYTYPLILSLFLVFIVTMVLLILFTEPIKIDANPCEIKIPQGASLWEIAEILETKQIVPNKNSFVFLSKLRFSQKSLKSGFYDLTGIQTTNQLLSLLLKGQNLSTKVTIPEGSTIRDIAVNVSKFINIDLDLFVSICYDSVFIADLGLKVDNLEGYLFPDTYFFYKNDSEKAILRKMTNNFHEKWKAIIQYIPNNTGKNQHEILTLASLIEGECVLDEERPRVSSLYQNRLQKGMKLESDPTIQYLISDGPRRLLTHDLKIDSPYNTYLYPGLPPGPVNNPGERSIIAAMMPEKTNFLYMVAQGDGSHYFTKNYHSFLQAKKRLQQIRRKYKEMN
ncbi:MAG: endolytic transglycosylase MltG [Candidatus Marinimicrobia bacterium]|nr:endolytic transglycosylase MltG [Candidatus Neomarinimicrobiota bacterium]